jgi:hypothetical protein
VRLLPRDPELKIRGTHGTLDVAPYSVGVQFNATLLPGQIPLAQKGSFMRLGKQTTAKANRAGQAFIGNSTPRSAPPLPDDSAFWRVYTGKTSRA